MATTTEDLTTGGPRVLADVAEVYHKRGHPIRVRIMDGAHGPAIDVREFVTPDAYPTSDTLPQAARAKGYRRRTRDDGYTGPTRKGLWVSLDAAEALADALASALVLAGSMTESEGAA